VSARKKRTDEGRCVLVLAEPFQDSDDLLAELVRRPDLHLLRVVTVEAAAVALRDLEVRLVLACPGTTAGTINTLLDDIARLRPGLPVLALRDRDGEESPSWKARAVGILRTPLAPALLTRTVDLALGFGS
jgi:hypothetical protein